MELPAVFASFVQLISSGTTIVYLLMDKKSMTANELATHFEVSKRTILRDIDTLTTASIPIYTMQGKGGEISIHDRFVLNKTVISESEQQQILFALQGMSATQHIDTESILSRLQSLFEKTNRDWIEVDFSRWGNNSTDRAKFASQKNALINQRSISFTYSGSYGETEGRKAYPLKLVFKSKSWYLQAFCLLKNDYRTFKINRMMNVKMLADTFDSTIFDTPEIEQSEYQSPDLIEVKLYFEPHVAYRVYDEFDERHITKNEDGSFIVTMSMPNNYWLYGYIVIPLFSHCLEIRKSGITRRFHFLCTVDFKWNGYIFSFGAAIKVISPQNIRDDIVKQAEKLKSKYISKT